MNDLKKTEPQPPGAGMKDMLGSNSEIGRKLQQYYDEIVQEEIPDRFTSLLSQLERMESGSEGSEGSRS